MQRFGDDNVTRNHSKIMCYILAHMNITRPVQSKRKWPESYVYGSSTSIAP